MPDDGLAFRPLPVLDRSAVVNVDVVRVAACQRVRGARAHRVQTSGVLESTTVGGREVDHLVDDAELGQLVYFERLETDLLPPAKPQVRGAVSRVS